ncbi:uncharacterized protein GGS22DRAFT_164712 [Annulohypoxylon maeteangense]|uniref:uncharacterized protein n=1 Tax=Annulohypoxylon maeteangense TaxID=1927788 RepID=UPI0020079891|nr:uncharacterized protein GGS22DRAFT_164712 [Annulohypoxylon maeteangense]KAI0884037.1 hypothetical protein GGS22DRAFT_164712 [Annulohypoxylon maeteangense]
MAIQNKSLVNATSSTNSNSSGQPTFINQSSIEPHVVEDDEDDANDPEMVDPQDTKAIGYLQGIHDFRFESLDRLVQNNTAISATATRPDKPYNDYQSRELHNEHQRTIWQRIREQAEVDDDIPTALFSPPRTYIEVRVSKWPVSDHYCCPCDIEEDDCEVIRIRAPKESPDGITKDMFIREVSDALYRRTPGEDGDSESSGYRIGDEDDRPVIERFDYMMQGGEDPDDAVHIMGHIFALTKGIKGHAGRFSRGC